MGEIEKLYEDMIGELDNLDSIKIYEYQGITLKYLSQETKKLDKFNFELLAFSLGYITGSKPTKEGVYYRPLGILTELYDSEGNLIPSKLSHITKDNVNYRVSRLKTTTNNFLKFHYANLIFDFSKTSGISIDRVKIINCIFKSGKVIFENYINKLEYNVLIYNIIGRILNIIKITKNNKYLEFFISAIIEYENKFGQDIYPGTWGHSFQLLLNSNDYIKSSISEKNKNIVIGKIEERLSKLIINNENFNSLEKAIKILLIVNRFDENEIEKLLFTLLKAILNDNCNNSNFIKVHNLERLEKICRIYLQGENFIKFSNIINHNIRQLGKLSLKEFKTFSYTNSVKIEELEDYASYLFNQHDILKGISNLLVSNLLTENDISYLKNFINDMLFRNLTGKHIIDNNGLMVQFIPPIYKGVITLDHIIDTVKSYHIPNQKLYIDYSVSEFKKRYSRSELLNFMQEKFFYSTIKTETLKKIIDYFYDGKYYEFCHLCIPQIENIVRFIADHIGIKTFSFNKESNGYDRKSLNVLLNDKELNNFFGFNIIFALKYILTEKCGFNLRNDISHGISSYKFYDETLGNLVFHCFIIFCKFIQIHPLHTL